MKHTKNCRNSLKKKRRNKKQSKKMRRNKQKCGENVNKKHEKCCFGLKKNVNNKQKNWQKLNENVNKKHKEAFAADSSFFLPQKKQGNSTCIPIFSTRSAARSNNATLHPREHAVVFRRKVHSHTGIGRPQRFVVFVGDSGSFF